MSETTPGERLYRLMRMRGMVNGEWRDQSDRVRNGFDLLAADFLDESRAPSDDLITLHEAAEETGFKPRTLRWRLARAGITKYRLGEGKRVYVRRGDLAEMMTAVPIRRRAA